ncbi:MAG: sulfatase [Planctomycetota bacterium]|nr:sulfatase [Planctomycetota bacterium]
MRNTCLYFFGLFGGLLLMGCGSVRTNSVENSLQQSPNVIIFFIDDMGWADVGFNGGTHVRTPNLDRMANEGIVFTDFYVAQPVCSASRTALLTGCYPNRLGITGALNPNSNHGINHKETTLAELCKTKGYATAIFGKWHLGHHSEFLPTKHGFDTFKGIPYSNDMWPMHPEARKGTYPPLPYFQDDVQVGENPDQRNFTSDFSQMTIEFIKKHKDEPFFVYVPHPMVHVPLYASDKWDGATELGLYTDVVAEIDDGVGQIMTTLQQLEIDKNTLVIFTSDNGPWLSYGDHAGQTGIYREGKGTTFEGGVRVPFVAWWPETIPKGAICNEPLMTIDLLPTIASLIKSPINESHIDGKNATNLLLGKPGATSPQEAYFFYYKKNDLEAMRCGRWKLHFPHGYRSMNGREIGNGGTPGKYDYSVRTDLELYDLINDPSETTNVVDDYPDVMTKLNALAEIARGDLGDNLTNVTPTGHREPGRVQADIP